MSVRIAPSIVSADFGDLEAAVRAVERGGAPSSPGRTVMVTVMTAWPGRIFTPADGACSTTVPGS